MQKIQIHNVEELEKVFSRKLKNVEISLKKKDYFLAKPLIVSGENITIFGNGARLYGAKEIKGGFTPCGDGMYKLQCPQPIRLFTAEGELLSAHYPRALLNTAYGKWDFEKKALQLSKEYLSYLEKNARITVLVDWSQWVDKKYTFDTDEEFAYVYFCEDVKEHLHNRLSQLPPKTPHVVFSDLSEFITEVGDWFYNEKLGELVIKWSEAINEQTFLLPTIENIVTVEKGENIRFENLAFSVCNWTFPLERGIAGLQSTIYSTFKEGVFTSHRPPAAVHVKGSDNVSFIGCEISYSAMTGLDVSPYSHHVTFEKGKIYASGGNALTIGYFREEEQNQMPAYIPKTKEELVSGVYIRNNEIDTTGIFDKAGTGVHVGHCRDLYVEDNTITNTSYSGIAAGWGWTSNEPSFITNFQINRNKITKYLSSVLVDGAGIYVLGGQSGEIRSSVSENYIEGTNGFGVLYLDEGASYIDATGNALVGDGYFGLLFCHDKANKLQSLHLNGNYGTKNRWHIGMNTLPDGLPQSERDIVCEGLIEFDPTDIKDEKLAEIIKNAGKKE